MSRFLLSLLLLLIFTGCAPQHRHHTHAKHHATKPVKVKHLSDGRVVYRDDSGMFWFYMYMMHSNSGTSSAAYTSGGRSFDYYETPTLSTTLPSGGAWVAASQLPAQTETQLEFELNDPRVEVAEVAVEMDAQGGMIETNEVQTEFDFSEQSNESMETNASESDTSSSDSSSDSSSSDSSGGGDSGGSSGDSGGSSDSSSSGE